MVIKKIEGANMKVKILFVLIILALVLNCSHRASLLMEEQKRYSPTAWESVEVYSTAPMDKEYEEIGFVTVNLPHHDGDKAKAELQKDAAKLGANAIINFELTLMLGRVVAKGIAVKYKE
jgi:hypothetical protein